jgi:predicted MFS family arabinose efflux permease
LGQSFSLLGDGFSSVAFAWITLGLTQSTLALGTVLAFQAIPRAVLTLVGGSLGAQWPPKRLMSLSSWARAVVMVAVAVCGLSDVLTVWLLAVAAGLFGAVDAFFQPARSSVLPSVVEPDLLAPANALLGVGSRVSAVIGPAVGGVVVAVSNADYAFLVDGVCFLLCGLCVARVTTRPPTETTTETTVETSAEIAADPAVETAVPVESTAAEEQQSPPEEGLLSRIRSGLRHAWSHPGIRTMLVVDTAISFCYAGPFAVGFADLAKFRLTGGSTALGLLDGALAGGAMLGALAGGVMGGRPRLGMLVAALAGWLAVGMAILGFTHNVIVAMAVVLTMGFAIGFEGVFGISWIQRNIHGSVLSRVISVDMVLGYAVGPLSLVLCGSLAQTRTELMFGGTAAILAVTALGVLNSKPARAMR